MTPATSTLPDGVVHGTPAGHKAGCVGEGNCPARYTHGMTCTDAHVRAMTTPDRYFKAHTRNPDPAEIARTLGFRPSTSQADAAAAAKEQRASAAARKANAARRTPASSAPAPTGEQPAAAEPAQPLAERSNDPRTPAPTPARAAVQAPGKGVAEGEDMGHPAPATRGKPAAHGTTSGYSKGCRDNCPGDPDTGKTCRQAAVEAARENRIKRQAAVEAARENRIKRQAAKEAPAPAPHSAQPPAPEPAPQPEPDERPEWAYVVLTNDLEKLRTELAAVIAQRDHARTLAIRLWDALHDHEAALEVVLRKWASEKDERQAAQRRLSEQSTLLRSMARQVLHAEQERRDDADLLAVTDRALADAYARVDELRARLIERAEIDAATTPWWRKRRTAGRATVAALTQTHQSDGRELD